jgi:hypothetical protein
LRPRNTRKGVLRREHGAGHVLEAVEAHLGQGFRRADDGAGEQVAVAAEVFGRRMQHEVGAEFERALQIGRAIGVVDYRQGAVAAGDGAHCRDVHQAHVRIGRRLEEHHAGGRIDRGVEVGRIGEVDVSHLDAELRQAMVEVAEGAAVERLVGDDLVARRQQGP